MRAPFSDRAWLQPSFCCGGSHGPNECPFPSEGPFQRGSGTGALAKQRSPRLGAGCVGRCIRDQFISFPSLQQVRQDSEAHGLRVVRGPGW